MIPSLLIVQLVLGATLMWCSFCRLVKTDHDTMREVRWAFAFELVAGGLVFGAPLMPILMPNEADWPTGSTPYWVWINLLASFSFIQLTTAVHWASGKVPTLFQRRRETDTPRFFNGWPMATVAMVLVAGLVAWPQMAISQAQAPIDTGPNSIVRVPDGEEVACANKHGCVIFTVEALRLVLQRANGSCGTNHLGRPA